jgi:hypothetical protein
MAIALACLITVPAQAETIRHPEGGSPSFVIPVPDGWTRATSAEGALDLTAPDNTAMVRFLIAPGESIDDEVAVAVRDLKASPPRNKTLTTISGHFGAAYDSDRTQDSGTHVSLHFVGVAVSGRRVAMILAQVADEADAARRAEARSIYSGVTMINETASPLHSWH